MKAKNLCFRCEYRALYFEEDYRPRSECGNIEMGVSSCYMFRPVKPFLVEANKEDLRPITADIISGRYHYAGEAKLKLTLEEIDGKTLLYWRKDDE